MTKRNIKREMKRMKSNHKNTIFDEMEKMSTEELFEHEDYELSGFQLFDEKEIVNLGKDHIMFKVMDRMMRSGGEITLTESEVYELKRTGMIR